MKRVIIKLITCVLLFSLVGCSTSTMYSYRGRSFENNKYTTYKYGDYIYISSGVIEQTDENSPLRSITFEPKWGYKKLEILSEKIKLVYEGKEYYLDRDFTLDKKDRKSLFYPIYKKGIKINGDFMLYIGKIRLDDKEIVEIPPLKFRKYIKVSEYNLLIEALKKDSFVEIYNGPLEDYKGD